MLCVYLVLDISVYHIPNPPPSFTPKTHTSDTR